MSSSTTTKLMVLVAAIILAVWMLPFGSVFGLASAHAAERTASSQQACADADEGDNEHPSGEDRSCENGSLGNSASDPDGDENGGADKPGGTGGLDLEDQDGNNGCGNDDDFEDDNNGNCGGRAGRVAAGGANNAGSGDARGGAAGGSRASAEQSSVLPARIVRAAAPASVLGEQVARPESDVLATTGVASMFAWLAAAAFGVGFGALLHRARLPRRAKA